MHKPGTHISHTHIQFLCPVVRKDSQDTVCACIRILGILQHSSILPSTTRGVVLSLSAVSAAVPQNPCSILCLVIADLVLREEESVLLPTRFGKFFARKRAYEESEQAVSEEAALAEPVCNTCRKRAGHEWVGQPEQVCPTHILCKWKLQ